MRAWWHTLLCRLGWHSYRIQNVAQLDTPPLYRPVCRFCGLESW